MLRKDVVVTAVASPITVASSLSGSCPAWVSQMSGDSVVQLLVVDGMIGGADEGLFALAVDVELRAWYPLIETWTFEGFWWRRRFTLGYDRVAQGLLCRAEAGWLGGLSGAPSVSEFGHARCCAVTIPVLRAIIFRD